MLGHSTYSHLPPEDRPAYHQYRSPDQIHGTSQPMADSIPLKTWAFFFGFDKHSINQYFSQNKRAAFFNFSELELYSHLIINRSNSILDLFSNRFGEKLFWGFSA
jgi:hypothetical protein